MVFKSISILSVCIICLFFTIACQPTPNSSRDSVRKSDLVGSRWVLTQLTLEGEEISFAADNAPTLEFRDELVGGGSGCNNYRAGWFLGRDGAFKLSGAISMTRMSCLDSIMQAERQYIQVFENARLLILENNMLIISSEVGELRFVDDK